MAVVGRSIKPDQATDINAHGASTDEERISAMEAHLADMHSGSNNQIPNEYFFDEDRNKNLSTQIFYVDFFRKDRNKKRYINYKSDIPSSDIPYKSLAPYDYCIVGCQFYMREDKTGDIMEIRDKANSYATLHTISLVSSGHEQYDDTIDITIVQGTELCVYATNKAPKDPLVRIFLRRIYP